MNDFSSKMKNLYTAMQSAYDSVAKHYGFSCEGCSDNCCTQRFFHYTFAEYLYLLEGLKLTDPEHIKQILDKAQTVIESYEREHKNGQRESLMCPINFDGLCTLYSHRPMICRMHGLPHRFRKPSGGPEERAGGCAVFEEQNPKTDWSVNRSPHYKELAGIEREIRQSRHIGGNLKLTTAEMLTQMKDSDPDLMKILKTLDS